MYYNMNLPQLLLWFRGFYKRQLEGPYPLLTYKVVNKVILWRRGHTLLRFLVEHKTVSGHTRVQIWWKKGHEIQINFILNPLIETPRKWYYTSDLNLSNV